MFGVFAKRFPLVAACFLSAAVGCNSTAPSSRADKVILLTVTCRIDVCPRIDKVKLLFSSVPYDPEEPPVSAKTIDLAANKLTKAEFDVLIWAGTKLSTNVAIKGQGLDSGSGSITAEGFTTAEFSDTGIVDALLCLAPPGQSCLQHVEESLERDSSESHDKLEHMGEPEIVFDSDALLDGDAEPVEDMPDTLEAPSDLEQERCMPREKRCDGDMLQECTEDGIHWKDLGVCDQACVEDHCAYCKPGARKCENSELSVCTLDGDTWNFVKTCELGCAGNDCAVCNAGESVCDEQEPDQRRFCLEDGSGWRTETCIHGCKDGACLLCRPSEDKKCADKDTLLVCNQDGNGWDTWGTCCPPGSCINDQCGSKAPYIFNISPDNADPDKDVDIEINGCNFVADSRVLVREGGHGPFYDEGKYENAESEFVSPTQIIFHITDLKDPWWPSNDYYLKVKNPDNQESNDKRFHVN